jgi:hypothetical protein
MTTEPTDHPAPDDQGAAPKAGGSAPPVPMSRGKIRRTRSGLVAERDEALFHLGGLVHDLHRRGEIDPALLERRAGRVDEIDQQIQLLDWRLETLDGERRARRYGGPIEAGHCLNCRTPFHADAQFCARCGVPFGPMSDPAGMTMEIQGLPPA